ncbi:5-formyltetrahydrofolate cyclo-ligase [Dyadobacter aurulentus]|uniref:5-formyltetrahydrofolate cyclo-ligase n=1 Tax=Dyadobacter sp. UC 10 TaxID=2605428 RepID=UPI0011F1DAD5|nr:5-formyltetrahydrofolate cyclo-ligase [Dyadobacter sp. UC 10]KAA0990683.1 5-formyltetrahydrofolate cyclo-ligase [Dyadobacter sp. UC 10]
MEKAFLRKEFLKKRMELTENENSLKNASIAEKTIDYVTNSSFLKLHLFLPHPAKNEVDCSKIARALWEIDPGICTIAPYVIPGTQEMRHYVLNNETTLLPNHWKIPEPDPATSQLVSPEGIDAVLVPLLAFDLNGFRVGYGGGYYDRFLKKCRADAVKIGLSFFEPVEEISDINLHDIPLDLCITPDRVYRF